MQNHFWTLGLALGLAPLTNLNITSGQDLPLAASVASNRLDNLLPPTVKMLFQWPAPDVLNSPKRLASDTPELIFTKTYCSDWMGDVFDPTWSVPPITDAIFLKAEFSDHDTVRLIWTSHGYRVEASQTAIAMAIKLIPVNGNSLGNDSIHRVQAAKDLAMQLFKDKAIYHLSNGDIGTVTNLKHFIASQSFPDDKPPQVTDEGIVHRTPLVSRRRQPIPPPVAGDTRWEMSTKAYEYWFRHVYWWNDGQAIGFYLQKTQGYGPLRGLDRLTFDGPVDNRFFGEKSDNHGPTTNKPPEVNP